MGPSVTGGPRVGKFAKRERDPAPPPATNAARVLRAASARAPEPVEGDAGASRAVEANGCYSDMRGTSTICVSPSHVSQCM